MSDFVRISSPFFVFLFSYPEFTTLNSLQTVPKELTLSERNSIVSHFKDLSEAEEGLETRAFDFHLPGKPPLFIKQGDDVLNEASTQYFFYALAQGNTSAPLIPKVFDAFFQEGDFFFVMEKIETPTVRTCNSDVESVAFAVKWLLDQMPLVPSSVFGCISSEEGACVLHPFYKEHRAPI
jgi:hypothetical protein